MGLIAHYNIRHSYLINYLSTLVLSIFYKTPSTQITMTRRVAYTMVFHVQHILFLHFMDSCILKLKNVSILTYSHVCLCVCQLCECWLYGVSIYLYDDCSLCVVCTFLINLTFTYWGRTSLLRMFVIR